MIPILWHSFYSIIKLEICDAVNLLLYFWMIWIIFPKQPCVLEFNHSHFQFSVFPSFVVHQQLLQFSPGGQAILVLKIAPSQFSMCQSWFPSSSTLSCSTLNFDTPRATPTRRVNVVAICNLHILS